METKLVHWWLSFFCLICIDIDSRMVWASQRFEGGFICFKLASDTESWLHENIYILGFAVEKWSKAACCSRQASNCFCYPINIWTEQMAFHPKSCCPEQACIFSIVWLWCFQAHFIPSLFMLGHYHGILFKIHSKQLLTVSNFSNCNICSLCYCYVQPVQEVLLLI